MKVSLITTVYNEGESVKDLIESVVGQIRQPDEFVIVDGGSTDNTQSLIQDYEEKYDWIKLVVEEGCNIAEGRNTAIENASYEQILLTDGGCELDQQWVGAMSKTFEEGYEVLSGLWKPKSENLFEFVQGEIRGHHYKAENVPENWAPSSRSAGITKTAWKEAGRYPEDLYTGEDSLFNTRVREAGYEWHVVRDAVAYWKMRPTWKSYFKQFYQYGEGDARAGLFNYPNKILGIPKSFLRIKTTFLGLIGFLGVFVASWLLLLTFAGFGVQYGSKIPSLRSSIAQRGLKTIPYWVIMIPFESVAYTLGWLKEKIIRF